MYALIRVYKQHPDIFIDATVPIGEEFMVARIYDGICYEFIE